MAYRGNYFHKYVRNLAFIPASLTVLMTFGLWTVNAQALVMGLLTEGPLSSYNVPPELNAATKPQAIYKFSDFPVFQVPLLAGPMTPEILWRDFFESGSRIGSILDPENAHE